MKIVYNGQELTPEQLKRLESCPPLIDYQAALRYAVNPSTRFMMRYAGNSVLRTPPGQLIALNPGLLTRLQ